jgi:transglutaminase-like putative cysteine protease
LKVRFADVGQRFVEKAERKRESEVRLRIEAQLDYQFDAAADVLLALEVAQLPDQRLISDMLTVSSPEPLVPMTGEQGIGQRTWAAAAPGRFVATYQAEVEIERPELDLHAVAAVPLRALPGLVVPFLWPSRYCRADKHREFAVATFGHLAGGELALGLAEWCRDNLAYTPGSSTEETSSVETFLERRGMCRDYAHLAISFARALGLPARMVSAYAWQLDPPDFHAVVEVWLDGGWYLLDPTGLAPVEGLVRIGVGRDAADVSFMSIFGAATLNAQSVCVERID